MESGPIYIGGPDRCGKTTMRAILASHPNISIPAVGSNMWTYFYGQFGDLVRKENFERCLDAMMHYKHVIFLKPDPDRIRKEFWQGPPTYARLFSLFHQQHAEREGKLRWGDQTGLIERYAKHIFEAYPAAKMIHMLRDPRDRYEASLALWPKGKGRAGGATARWLYSLFLARRNLQRYPGHYKIVRFESLIRDPEKIIREICIFLGEDYVPGMLAMEGAPSHREKLLQGRGIESGASPLSENFIGLYRRAIPKQEIAYMQNLAGKQMMELGYSLDAIKFSPNEWVVYMLYSLPLNWMRMMTWLSLELIQHNMPALIGRRPSPKMVIRDSGSRNIGSKTA
jgi:hypothetical protein